MLKQSLLAMLALAFSAYTANATPMTVSFTGSNGATPISGSFQYDSTLALTPDGSNSWDASFVGNTILNGTTHSATLLVGIDSNIPFCDSGASTCDFFFFDIYLDANDALGPESSVDVNNDTLVIVDFELAAGTVTPGALPDFSIPDSSITAFVIEYATAGNATIDPAFNEWTAASFNTNATGSVTPVPEPDALLLLGSAILGLAGLKRGQGARAGTRG